MDSTVALCRPKMNRRSMLSVVGTAGLASVAGCTLRNSGSGTDEEQSLSEFVISATAQDSPEDIERDFAPLAAWIEEETEVPTTIHAVRGDSTAINALATGQSHAAYLRGGPAWVGWQQFGLEPLVFESDADGNTSYVAAAWIRAESEYTSVVELEGKDSCHTGDLTGAGMLIPTAHLAHEGAVSFDESDDITAIRDAVEDFFGNPVVGGGYVGALQCLSTGAGDVAFVRKSTPADYCDSEDPPDWCLDMDEYEILEEFASVPSHPIMASPELSSEEFSLLQNALLALNDTADGRDILDEVLGVAKLKSASAADHLGEYGGLIEVLPGIEDYLIEGDDG